MPERNERLFARLEEGASAALVAREFGISSARVRQIRNKIANERRWKAKREGFSDEVKVASALLNLQRITSKLTLVLEP